MLPFMPCHFELDNKNVLVTETGRVVGLVGFGSARAGPLGSIKMYPFGMSLAPIHRMCGYINTDSSTGERAFVPCERFDKAEEEMWAAIWKHLPSNYYADIVDGRDPIEAIDHAMRLATILDLFPVARQEDGMRGVRPKDRAYLDALPLFLSYRSPAGREAGAAPYDKGLEARWRGLIGQAVPLEPWQAASKLVADEADDDNAAGALPLTLQVAPEVVFVPVDAATLHVCILRVLLIMPRSLAKFASA